MNEGIIAFCIAYLVVAMLIMVGLALSAARRSPAHHLGHSVWLCTGCHTLHTQPVTHCPRGHQIVEATIWQPTLDKEDDDAWPGRAIKPTICQ